MFYYAYKDSLLAAQKKYRGFTEIGEAKAMRYPGRVYLLNEIDPAKSRCSFSVSDPSLAFLTEEGLHLLKKTRPAAELPEWILQRIEENRVTSLNTGYPRWEDVIGHSDPAKWRVNIAGLGDVGGTLAVGLRLLGGGCINSIGLFDLDENRMSRWASEAGQVLNTLDENAQPGVVKIRGEEIFDCDMFVFCVSAGVPPVGAGACDVRMAQFEGNSRIIRRYAEDARKSGFRGIFAVVSDPVDLLCREALLRSNTNGGGEIDFGGLRPEQIRGYGLGVMNARAALYASQREDAAHYITEGRAFGPHGEGLVIADSIENYDDQLSLYLTEKAKSANLEIRSYGYKPYVAPALSSGAIPIISTISGKWHYSSTFIGGVFIGSLNRVTSSGVQVESLDIPDPLWERIGRTYKKLEGLM